MSICKILCQWLSYSLPIVFIVTSLECFQDVCCAAVTINGTGRPKLQAAAIAGISLGAFATAVMLGFLVALCALIGMRRRRARQLTQKQSELEPTYKTADNPFAIPSGQNVSYSHVFTCVCILDYIHMKTSVVLCVYCTRTQCTRPNVQ